MWIGVHIMMLFGFGNLMTFLHRYGYSASGYTFVMTCLGKRAHTTKRKARM